MTTISTTNSLLVRQTGSSIEYKPASSSSWTTISSWPVTIVNTNTSTTLVVSFTTDLILTSSANYFICGSDAIQFGDTSLRTNGTRPTITISGVSSYPGLIQNGNDAIIGTTGYNSIAICNLFVSATGGSELVSYGGWIGQRGFCRGTQEIFIVNCGSDGPIGDSCGGIVGGFAVSADNSLLIIRGCTSAGVINPGAGGIVGQNSGTAAGVLLDVGGCASFGNINGGGGIFGNNCGSGAPSASARAFNCYSTGTIDIEGGGIFGSYAGSSGGGASADNCYSLGAILAGGDGAGGIFGSYAADNAGSAGATNCYSIGAIGIGCGGIFGGNYTPGSAVANNCYTTGATADTNTGGIWAGSSSDTISPSINSYAEGNHNSSGWKDILAIIHLQGAPSGGPIGTTWVSLGTNTPYRFLSLGFSPYLLNNINGPYILTVIYAQTITQNSSTIPSILPAGYTYTLIGINGNSLSTYPTISINAATGQITAGAATPPGLYTCVLQSEINPYSMTRVLLTVTESGPIPVPTAVAFSPCCNTPLLLRNSPTGNVTNEVLAINRSGKTIIQNVNTYSNSISTNRTTYLAKPVFQSYRDYMLYLQSNN